jgi:hypothetical protein
MGAAVMAVPAMTSLTYYIPSICEVARPGGPAPLPPCGEGSGVGVNAGKANDQAKLSD